jgi:arylsulfatase A-like enzyme
LRRVNGGSADGYAHARTGFHQGLKSDSQVTNKLLAGYKVGDMTYKVHLDGYNLVPYLTGEVAKDPRASFFYINDDQQLVGLRYDNWKFVFLEQRAPGQLLVWANPFTNLRVPKIFNLRTEVVPVV